MSPWIQDAVLPYIEKLAEFRNEIRTIALNQKCLSKQLSGTVCLLTHVITIATSILEACDKLRDETLPSLGVRLEDKGGQCYSLVGII